MTISRQFAPALIGESFKTCPDDSRRVIHASLKSSSDLDSGVLTDSGGVATYNDSGIQNGAAAYIMWTPSAAQISELEKSCHIHLEVESSFMAHTVSAENTLICLGTIQHRINMSGTEHLYEKLDGVTATSLKSKVTTNENALVNVSVRPESHTVIDIVIQGSQQDFYFDSLLVYSTTLQAAIDYSTITLFARADGTLLWGGGTDPCVERIKNFYVRSGSIGHSHHPQLSNIHIYGDSLMQQGNLPAGYRDSTGVAAAGATWEDIGCTAAVIKKMQGKTIRSKVQNHAISGDALADVIGDIAVTTTLAGQIVVINIGINDAKSGTLTTNWQTDYEGLIVSLTALGVDHIFLCNLTSTAEDATEPAPESTTRAAIDEANTALDVIVAANSKCTLVNLSDEFGGSDFIIDYYKSANLHWNQKGSRIAGELIGNIILKRYGV